ncbi:MAG: diacylglycerol kinase family lipid kinase [Bacteroidia bacterium]|nr:diacylglycerol kinase family lipid kinase [Bacteroidia bacterium]MCZ2277819.1 diacylglycerol kinase family lipid kinase [Bacteroidia bacterium]
MNKKFLFILNPKAGQGMNPSVKEYIRSVFNTEEAEIKFTQYAGHAAELSTEAVTKNLFAVVAVGGDGTVNEVATALVHCNTALGIIPLGSGNGFSNFLKIPSNLKEALQIIRNGNIRVIDSFQANNHFGINLAGAGFDALIAFQFSNSKKRGLINYARLVLKNYFGYAEENYTVSIDGKEIKRKALLVEVANGNQFGNRAVIAASACLDDRLLDVVILRKGLLYQVPLLVTGLFSGKKLSPSVAEYFTGKHIKISSESEMFLHTDGEPLPSSKLLDVKIISQSIRVIC